MTAKSKTRNPAAPKARPTFLEFLAAKLIDVEDAARRGEPGMAEKADCFARVLASTAANEQRPAPKHYGKARPTLADFDHAAEKWGNS